MGWYEALKDVVTAAERLKDADLKQRAAAVQVECAALAEENARLREERNELREQLRLRAVMEYDENVYWMRDGDKRVGPYCPKCWDGDSKTARMEERSDDHYRRCRVCPTIVAKPGRDPAYRTPSWDAGDPYRDA